ncbi:MAG: galactose-1-phosphate uridylyltransferase [Acidobacteria bacterium]|nr:galactose-1-phosphate uridylyltransferase [Acidobacteriota bacterium]
MSELRRDPITGRTVIIAPERLRPMALPLETLRGGSCPFCEGREAIAGREILAWRTPDHPHNGGGWRVRVVPNREPALRVESHYAEPADALFQRLGGLGAHEVIIESPDHGANWSTMTAYDLRVVLWAWRERIRDLRRDVRLKSFLIVKNVGAAAGATLDHAHSQLVALPFVPQHLEDERAGARARHDDTGSCAFCAVVDEEVRGGSRLVSTDDNTIAFTPFASRVPFETWVMSRRHGAAFDEETDEGLSAVAERLSDTLRRLYVALAAPPHTVLLHTAPVGEADRSSYHWHLEIIPRLSAESGLAWDGGIHVNPVAPEDAARHLRDSRRP